MLHRKNLLVILPACLAVSLAGGSRFYPAEEFEMFEDKWFIVCARGRAAALGGM